MGSVHTTVKIVNNTSSDIIDTKVTNFDNFDWASNPRNHLQGLQIRKRTCKNVPQILNAIASNCPFTLEVFYEDQTADQIRLRQKYAIEQHCGEHFQHLKKAHEVSFRKEKDKTLVVTFSDTAAQLQNEHAKSKNKEAEAAMQQKKYEEALKKFDEALKLANQAATINVIKTNMSEVRKKQAEAAFKEGFDLEANSTEDNSSSANQMFCIAKNKLQEAKTLNDSNEIQKNLNLIDCKIEGNKLFNEANQLEQEAFGKFKAAKTSNDLNIAQNQYKEALKKYNEAVKKFEGGVQIDKVLEGSVKTAEEAVERIEKICDDIQKAKLHLNIEQVTEEKENVQENSDEVTNENLQELIDEPN